MELRKLDEEFEDVSVGAGEESSPHGGTPPRKMHFGTSALPELIVKYAPAAAVFVFSALTSGAPFVLDTYPFGIAALCAAEGSAFFIASLAGVLLGSLSVNGGVRIALIACAVSADARSFSSGESAEGCRAPRAGDSTPRRRAISSRDLPPLRSSAKAKR